MIEYRFWLSSMVNKEIFCFRPTLAARKHKKEHIKAVYCHPAYLTYRQSISCEMPGWMKHKLESRFPGEISTTSNMQMTPPLPQKAEKNYRAF